MNKILLFVLIAILISGCSENDDTEYPTSPLHKSEAHNYTSLKNNDFSQLSDGYQGIIRLFSRHHLNGNDKDGEHADAEFVVHGAGSLISFKGKLYILTAKHVILPNSKLRSVSLNDDDPIEFSSISSISSEVLIGGLGIEPIQIAFSQKDDVCVLSVPDSDRNKIIQTFSRDGQAPISFTSSDDIGLNPGIYVEAWGFPAQHNPQVEHVLISAVNVGQLILNKALLRGYSGGPVFTLPKDASKKAFVGIIIRADDKANQSMVLPRSSISSILICVRDNQPTTGISRVKKSQEAQIGDVKYRFIPYKG